MNKLKNDELVKTALGSLSYAYGLPPICDILNVAEKKQKYLLNTTEALVLDAFNDVGINLGKDSDGVIIFPNEEIRKLIIEIAPKIIN